MNKEGFGYPPAEYVWLGLGSEGRDEQTIITDQDNMLIYEQGNNLSAEQPCDYYFKVFSEKTVEHLHHVGFENVRAVLCPLMSGGEVL